MTLLDFDELPVDSGVQMTMLDRGVLTARAIGSTGIATDFGQTVFVAMNGSDTTGNGTLGRPFATIQAGINRALALGASGSTPFTVQVFPGQYGSFQLAKGTYVAGLGHPGTVFINAAISNILGDGTWGSGVSSAGVSNLTFGGSMTLDLTGSTAIVDFFINNIMLGSGANLAFTGVAGLIVYLQNILSKGATSSNLTLTDVSASNMNACFFRNGTLTFSATQNFSQTHRIEGASTGGTISVTSTQTSTQLVVAFYNSMNPLVPTGHTLTGARSQLTTRAAWQVTGPDAATTFSFGQIPNGGTVIMPQGAENVIESNPTAARTYTLEPGGIAGTRVRVINTNGANAITMAYAGGAAGPGVVVAAATTVELYASSGTQWRLGG